MVALAVPDMRQTRTKSAFIAGFNAMTIALQPTRLLVYGKLPIATTTPCTELIPDWLRLRKVSGT